MSMERIDKILSSQNIATRSEAKELIRKKKISVNGKIVLKPDEKCNPETAEISVDGKLISFKKYVYIMMNKPSGVLSASNDKYAVKVTSVIREEE